MKLHTILDAINPLCISKDIDPMRELSPCISVDCDKNDLLFVNRRICGAYTLTPSDVKCLPYAIVADSEYCELFGRIIPVIAVSNVREAFARACYIDNGIESTPLKITCVTGTNGKTTTATMLHSILSHVGIKVGFIGTGNIISPISKMSAPDYSMTTPDPQVLYPALAKMASDGCTHVVMEASSHAIALGKLAPLRFERGIFTNLSPEHMDFHKDIEDYFKTKLSLFSQCNGGIYNVDDEYGARAYEEAEGARSGVGIIRRADAYVTDIKQNGFLSSDFLYRENGLITSVHLPMGGAFNIYNAAIAMRAALELGVSPKEAKEALAALRPPEGRCEVVRLTPTVIIDYAHTPNAMENLLKMLNRNKKIGQTLSVVFGCGGRRDREKRPLMAASAEKYADKIYVTEDNSRDENPKEIYNDMALGFKDSTKHRYIPNRREAILTALRESNENDVIAIVGKGHERYITNAEGTCYFNEKEIIGEYYRERQICE